METQEQRDRKREKWLSSPAMIKWYRDGDITFKKLKQINKDNKEEINDVYTYKTILYPPNSTPPSSN